jgi:hypothetical protein
MPIQSALMLAAAVASYEHVERPLRRDEWSSQSWKTISYGAGGLVTAAAIILVLHSYSPLLFIRNYNVVVPLIGLGLPFNPTYVVDGAARVLKSNTLAMHGPIYNRERPDDFRVGRQSRRRASGFAIRRAREAGHGHSPGLNAGRTVSDEARRGLSSQADSIRQNCGTDPPRRRYFAGAHLSGPYERECAA